MTQRVLREREGLVEAQPEKRRLTTILSVDVVGYSLLMGDDEAGTLAALKKHRRELIEPKTVNRAEIAGGYFV